jgi:hypothetical protein
MEDFFPGEDRRGISIVGRGFLQHTCPCSLQDLLDLWKNADAAIPIYKEARAEYAKLLSP